MRSGNLRVTPKGFRGNSDYLIVYTRVGKRGAATGESGLFPAIPAQPANKASWIRIAPG